MFSSHKALRKGEITDVCNSFKDRDNYEDIKNKACEIAGKSSRMILCI